MTTTNDGGPAFPQTEEVYNYNENRWATQSTGGISIRAYFAAKAMAGIVSSIRSECEYQRLRGLAEQSGLPSVSAWIARDSVKQADALIAALEEKP